MGVPGIAANRSAARAAARGRHQHLAARQPAAAPGTTTKINSPRQRGIRSGIGFAAGKTSRRSAAGEIRCCRERTGGARAQRPGEWAGERAATKEREKKMFVGRFSSRCRVAASRHCVAAKTKSKIAVRMPGVAAAEPTAACGGRGGTGIACQAHRIGSGSREGDAGALGARRARLVSGERGCQPSIVASQVIPRHFSKFAPRLVCAPCSLAGSAWWARMCMLPALCPGVRVHPGVMLDRPIPRIPHRARSAPRLHFVHKLAKTLFAVVCPRTVQRRLMPPTAGMWVWGQQ